jgi:hypothetical protein
MHICINGICGRDPLVRSLDGGSFAEDCREARCQPCRAEVVQKVHDFLRPHIVFCKGFDPRRGSYGWKHDLQRALGQYVSNGEFLAALLKFPEARIKPDGLNARVNVAYRAKSGRIKAVCLPCAVAGRTRPRSGGPGWTNPTNSGRSGPTPPSQSRLWLRRRTRSVAFRR